MAFKMKGFPYPGKSPVQQAKKPQGPTAKSNRIKADQKEDTKQIRAVDPVTGGNNAEYEKEAGKLHAAFKTGQISANELREKKKALIARLRKKPPTQQKKIDKTMEKEAAREDKVMEETAKKRGYYYKIDGRNVTKVEYNKYKNKPGNMEGGGKTTNDPDPDGSKAKRKADRAKLAKPTVLTKSQTKAIEKKPPLQAHCTKKK